MKPPLSKRERDRKIKQIYRDMEAKKRALGLRAQGPAITSCPTCGRTKVDLCRVASQVEDALETLALDGRAMPRVAVMGCAVNGPGEAREADFGIAGGKHEGLLFRRGEIIRKVPEAELLPALREELLGEL